MEGPKNHYNGDQYWLREVVRENDCNVVLKMQGNGGLSNATEISSETNS